MRPAGKPQRLRGEAESSSYYYLFIMGKSKSGGTRSYIRGRVGADVYSIGKDGKGKKQQVVRSLAETVANPQTEAQMRGRMIMSTVMQAVSAMAILCDHSFDNVVAGQPSLSEFISRNYALIKADVAAHPSEGNSFGLNKYQEKGAKQGAYEISYGAQILPAALANSAEGFVITGTGESLTIAAVRAALGLGESEYITMCGLDANGILSFTRLHLNSALADTTVITADNATEALGLESVGTPTISVSGMAITIVLGNAQANSAAIISKKVNGSYKHNSATLLAPSAPQFTADVALATYPIGSEMILNGGNFNGGGSVTPVTPTYDPSISGVTFKGSASAKGTKITVTGASDALVMNVTGLDPSKSYAMILNDTDASIPAGGVPISLEWNIVNGSARISAWSSDDNGDYYLMLAEVVPDSSSDGYTKVETWCQLTINVSD